MDAFSFPTVNLSAETRIGHNVSLATEVGYQFYAFRKIDTQYVTPHGIKANMELRFYNLFTKDIRKENTLTGPYLGFNFFYRANENNLTLQYYPHYMGNTKTDCMWANRVVWGSNVVLGYQGSLSGCVFVDAYVGLGIMNRTNLNYNREYNNNTDSLFRAVDFNIAEPIDNAYLREHDGWRVNFNFGLRVGIKIK